MRLLATNSNPNKPLLIADANGINLKSLTPLPANFYLQKTIKVAAELLGKGLYIKHSLGEFLVQLVEVEAYLADDPASHSYRGPTRRNQSMFAIGGTCYVYLCYGINFCMNVVTGPEHLGEAILLRGAVPLLGQDKMKNLRGIAGLESFSSTRSQRNLLNGPGKLTKGLGVDLKFDGMRFDQPTFKIVDLGNRLPKGSIGVSPRIGISKSKDELLRFYIKNCEFVSRFSGKVSV